ncbi:MAG: hypothetical protein SFX72_08260 [Isosphaeraceae bacterium]|nr:hypothetical protein [Isosphaeraceae bacterium]
MSRIKLVPVDRPEVAPLAISPRLRSQLVYFGAAEGTEGVPPLADGEYFFLRHEVLGWLEDGAISLVSPLDTANKTEVELEEEQETMLLWLDRNDVSRVRLEE